MSAALPLTTNDMLPYLLLINKKGTKAIQQKQFLGCSCDSVYFPVYFYKVCSKYEKHHPASKEVQIPSLRFWFLIL